MILKKFVPQRTCIGCMKKFDKNKLLKIVKNKNGEVLVCEDNLAMGRGAYICKNSNCVDTAQKRNKLQRALKGKVDNETYDILRKRCGDDA